MTIPVAGLLVSAYAIGVAVGGPVLTVFTSRFSQRNVLISLMIVFSLAQVLCAIAPDYGLLLAARLLSACAHGVFFGAGNVVVVGLVPPERRGAAFSLFISGITVANLPRAPRRQRQSGCISAGASPSLPSQRSAPLPRSCFS